jgi:hypothetical protein
VCTERSGPPDFSRLQGSAVSSGKKSTGATTLDQLVSGYLAPEHRDQPGQDCALAALVCEMPRQNEGVRNKFTAGLRGMLARSSGKMDAGLKQRKRDEQVLAAVASLIGALVLAGAVNDPDLSDAILRATASAWTVDRQIRSPRVSYLSTLHNSRQRIAHVDERHRVTTF